ncbi:response regulator transcription factor [Actinoplanes sp. NPDC049681]|uniref:response regulator transcription factor n=1 Tax=Actinoplanes sp. NPDC049681 TaxID=3363905 RepID=UPI0037BDA828
MTATMERGDSPAATMLLPGRAAASWSVLLVESDSREMKELANRLRRHGHQVEGTQTGGVALRICERFDLILLEMELPDLDGLEVCRAIRGSCDVPVIAVTSGGTVLDRVLALQAGADDYVAKPYAFPELMARMDAVMRRALGRPRTAPVISHGPLQIDVPLRKVSLAGRDLGVTRKEFDLLCLLAANPDKVMPRQRIMQQVWGNSWSRRTVDTHVSSLRSKLGSQDWIVTVRGVGFRFGRP